MRIPLKMGRLQTALTQLFERKGIPTVLEQSVKAENFLGFPNTEKGVWRITDGAEPTGAVFRFIEQGEASTVKQLPLKDIQWDHSPLCDEPHLGAVLGHGVLENGTELPNFQICREIYQPSLGETDIKMDDYLALEEAIRPFQLGQQNFPKNLEARLTNAREAYFKTLSIVSSAPQHSYNEFFRLMNNCIIQNKEPDLNLFNLSLDPENNFNLCDLYPEIQKYRRHSTLTEAFKNMFQVPLSWYALWLNHEKASFERLYNSIVQKADTANKATQLDTTFAEIVKNDKLST